MTKLERIDRQSVSLDTVIPAVHPISGYLQSILSQQSGFIGREYELTLIEQHFKDPACHLLTLVGLGGVGKTRIACEAAARAIHNFTNGSYFVPLAPLSDPDLVATLLASSIGLFLHGDESPREQVITYLSKHELLLVLDNFEHLMGATDLIVDILQRAPSVRILVTSRERLNLREEWVLDISGLDYPLDEPREGLEGYSAIQLFLKYAWRVKAGFVLTEANRACVVRICQLVEGMPLGIELAASWVRVMSCQRIRDEIARNLDFLTSNLRNVPEKHSSIRGVFEHSYNLLTPEQQQVFRKLSVFRGGFTHEAAHEVAGASLQTLTALIDKSLLRVDANERYDLHELLRQYAGEQLSTSIDRDAVHDAHSAYYTDFISGRIEDLKGRRQIGALTEIKADFENLRMAWMWSVEHKQAQYIEKMLEPLRLFCGLNSREQEGRMLFSSALAVFTPEQQFERLWGRLASYTDKNSVTQLQHALEIAHRHNDLAEIAQCLLNLGKMADTQVQRQTYFQQSIHYYERIQDRFNVADVLYQLTSSMMFVNYDGMWAEFQKYGEESLRLRREIGDQVGIAWAIAPIAHGATRVGRFEEAERLWLERIALGQALDVRALLATGYAHISYAVYFFQCHFDKARTTAEAAVKIGTDVNHLHSVGFGLATLSLLASMEENYLEAKRLCQRATSITSTLWVLGVINWALAIAACGLEEHQNLYEYTSAALQYLVPMFARVGFTVCLPVVAIFYAQEGDVITAVKFLALAFAHISYARWIEQWPLLSRLRVSWESSLGSDVYAETWERGVLLNLDNVARELMEQFQHRPSSAKGGSTASDVLTLSERELEVLRLVAAGCSNQEISERLYIGVSTVKKHINHIYDKLDAKNRTQAVALAREKRLLIP